MTKQGLCYSLAFEQFAAQLPLAVDDALKTRAANVVPPGAGLLIASLIYSSY